MKQPLSPIYWMNIGDRAMPFLALVEHTNFIGTGELRRQPHPLHLELPAPGPRVLRAWTRTQLWAIFEPALKRINPAFSSDWVNAALGVQGAVRAADHRPATTAQYQPDHRTPVDGLYLETMTQIYPEDRGQNYSIKMGEEVAKMVVEDHEKRIAPHIRAKAAESLSQSPNRSCTRAP